MDLDIKLLELEKDVDKSKKEISEKRCGVVDKQILSLQKELGVEGDKKL